MSSKKFTKSHALTLPEDKANFRKSVLDLFTGKHSGHLGRYVFSSPLHAQDRVRGNEHWSRFINNSTGYYPNHDIIQILTSSAGQIGRIIADSNVFVDLGSGATESFEKKILPILSQGKFSDFVNVDLCGEFPEAIAQKISRQGLSLKVSGFTCNIFEEIPVFTSKTTLCLLGITLGNIIAELTPAGIETALANALRHFASALKRTGGYFIFDYDTNIDGQSILSSYEDPHYHAMELTILDRVKRDLNTTSFDPQQFEHMTLWHPELCLLAQNLRAKCGMAFSIEGQEVRLPQGHLLHTGNSFKYSDETLYKAATAAGLQKRAIFHQPNSTMRLAIYST